MARNLSSDAAPGNSNEMDKGQVEEKLPHANPLQFYISELRNLPGYSVSTVDLTSRPLPEERQRVWILGSRQDGYSAEAWKADILRSEDAEAPRHHLRCYFDAYGESFSDKTTWTPEVWKTEKEYAKHYARAVDQAIKAKRLTAEQAVVPLAERASSTKGKGMEFLTPWQKASLDVCALIASALKKELAEESSMSPESLFTCADISQSANRGPVHITGQWGTLCTSSRLVDLDSFRILSGKGMMAMLGQNMDNKHCVGVSDSDLRSMAGNAMSFTQLTRVLLPVVGRWIAARQS